MDDAGEEVALELEALAITYGDALSSESLEAGVVIITMQLTPRGVEDDPRLAFVSATLVLEAGRDYPSAAGPAVSLLDVKGLSDSSVASMLQILQEEAHAMPGELVLGHLCELALDLITEHNKPEGECCFCLEPLLRDSSSSNNGVIAPSPAYSVTKLACFHAFHSSCFSAWFKWQQNCLQQREIQLKEEYKSMAPSYLEKEGIWSEEVAADSSTSAGAGGATSSNPEASLVRQIYAVKCPRCRCEVHPKDLAAALPPPQPSVASKNSPANSNKGKDTSKESIWDEAAHPSPSAVLQPEALKQLQDLQRRFAEVLRVQRACHGLVEESVAVSLGDIQAAVENDRAIQAAAANLQLSSAPEKGTHIVINNNNNRSSSDNSSAQQQGRGRGRGTGGRGAGERRGGGGGGGGGRGQKTAGDRGRRGGTNRGRGGEGRAAGDSGRGQNRGYKEGTKQQPSKTPPPAPIRL